MGRREIAGREGVIDYRDEVSADVFIPIPDAALKQRDAQRSEISLADQYHADLRLLAIASSVDLEGFLSISASIGRRGLGANSDGGDTGDGRDFAPDLLDVSGARYA